MNNSHSIHSNKNLFILFICPAIQMLGIAHFGKHCFLGAFDLIDFYLRIWLEKKFYSSQILSKSYSWNYIPSGYFEFLGQTNKQNFVCCLELQFFDKLLVSLESRAFFLTEKILYRPNLQYPDFLWNQIQYSS